VKNQDKYKYDFKMYIDGSIVSLIFPRTIAFIYLLFTDKKTHSGDLFITHILLSALIIFDLLMFISLPFRKIYQMVKRKKGVLSEKNKRTF